jgi:undecaprenyl diphosphate synthase
MQSYFTAQSKTPPLHTAIIMDGNGRWAKSRGLPRIEGHRAGAVAARRIIEEAPALGIRILTLFTFSSDNWKRPPKEIHALMRMLAWHLRKEAAECVRKGVRVSLIGRRDRLPEPVLEAAQFAEASTAEGRDLHVRFAVDYSGRDAILDAARQASPLARESLSGVLGCDVDLLIRSGGECRLSDFLLWECAYAELFFTGRLWPDFSPEDLREAVESFHARDRRFGGVKETNSLGESFIAHEARAIHHVRGDRWLR